MQKEHFDQAHRAKDEHILKVKEQVRFFPNKQYSMKLKWLTWTVREILERGCSSIIEGPSGKKYRRNQAHLKPICHDGSSFQDPPKAKKKNPMKSDNLDSFQDPRLKQKKSVTFKDDLIVLESILNRGANETSDLTSNSALFTLFTLIITTRTALIQREPSESCHRGPHSTKASSFHLTSRH